jgi:hypothetical protein
MQEIAMPFPRRLFLLTALGLASASAAFAHHGWSWAEPELTTLEARVEAVSVAPPHPSLTVTDASGQLWQVELGNPGRTERSGFTGDTVQPGGSITILGNRSLDPAEFVIKAVRVTVEGQQYDMYPERIPTN